MHLNGSAMYIICKNVECILNDYESRCKSTSQEYRMDQVQQDQSIGKLLTEIKLT